MEEDDGVTRPGTHVVQSNVRELGKVVTDHRARRDNWAAVPALSSRAAMYRAMPFL
jgi:hypothetical protein